MLAPDAADSAAIRRTSDNGQGSLRLLAFPHARNPRLLLPAEHARAAATAVRRSSEGGSPWQTWAAQIAAFGVSAGLLADFPANLLTLRFGNDTAEDVPLLRHLSQVVGEELTVAVRTGRGRPNGKPVLLLLSPDGRVLGFAKVGGNVLTRGLVRNEARVLAGFDDDERERLSFDVPRILHHGPWHDLELLVVTAIKGGRGSPRDPARHAMREIAGRCGLDLLPLGASGFWEQTQARLARLQAQDASVGALVTAERVVSERLGDERLLFGGWHGDWTPWNMSANGERLSVWDWERSGPSAPVGLDLAHHLMMVANHRRRLDSRSIRRLGQRAEPVIGDLGQATRHASLLILLALLEMALRFEEARAVGIAITNRYTPLLTSAITFIGEPFSHGGSDRPTPHHAG